MGVELLSKFFQLVVTAIIARLVLHLYKAVVVEPRKIRSVMRKQGLSGPPSAFLFGNIFDIKRANEAAAAPISGAPSSHNCGAAIRPLVNKWREEYGDLFMFALGNKQIVHVTNPEIVREITTCTSLDLGKPTYQAKERGALLGQGILTSNGAKWEHQRKIIAPELYMDKVKGMVHLVQDSAITLLHTWKQLVQTQGGLADIKVDSHLRSFSADVISRACFGSNYVKGKEIFLKLRALQEAETKKILFIGIPGYRNLPTQSNRKAWALEREIKRLILNVVNERKRGGSQCDLLQMVVEGAKDGDLSQEAMDQFIVDNCKNIYFAGYETTAVSAIWCLMLLASNPHWQERIRAEVQHVCNDQIPNRNSIQKMKLLTMAINETLRLYPPASVVPREALKDIKIGDINFPRGINLWTLVTTLHTDPDIWGPDSYQFNPERFADGITSACKYPHLYIPFGFGPRRCLGQNMALVELKILISLILSRFSLTLSPKYVHSPSLKMGVEPGHGLHLLVKEL